MDDQRKGFISLGLLVSLASNVLVGPPVLCVGTSDHLSLEPAYADYCRSTPLQGLSHGEGFTGSGFGGCGQCQDLSIPVSPSCDPTPRVGQGGHLLQLSPWPPSVGACMDPPFDLPSSADNPLPLRGPLVNLRTTFLRF